MREFNFAVGLCIAILFFIGVGVGDYFKGGQMKRAAIENGCAQYNQKTSKFEWVGAEQETPEYFEH